MNKRMLTIIGLVLSIILVLLLVVRATYSLIINVAGEGNMVKPAKLISIRDIITNDDGEYNNYYHELIDELEITTDEANILINSASLNDALNKLINNVVLVRYIKGTRFTDEEIIDLIVNAIMTDSDIDDSLKEKLILKLREYIRDITSYLYNIEMQ